MPHPRRHPLFAPGLLPLGLFLLSCCLLGALTLAGCSRDRVMEPRSGTGLRLKIRTAPRGIAEPAPGPVDTIRVTVRDAGGGLLAALDIPIAAGQQTFQAALDVPPGTERIVTVMALGPRTLLGGDEGLPGSDRGILFYDRVDNVSIEVGQSTPLAVTLRGFVPGLGAPELLAGEGHRVRWNRVPGAVRYQLLRRFDGGQTTHALTDTVFEADGLPSTYAVRAFELGDGAGALSDYATADLPPPPSVPTGLVASGASTTRIDLSWNASAGAGPITYDVDRRIDPSLTFASLATGLAGTTLADADVSGDRTFHYRVRAVGRGGPSDWSPEAAGAALPGAPSGLTATAGSPTQVTLAWTRGTGRVDSYDIQRRVPPGAFADLPDHPGDVTTFDDLTVAAGTAYEYRVVPRNVSGAGAGSNTAGVTTPTPAPNAPTNLAAHATAATQIDLSWTDNSGNETGFEVQRATGESGTFLTLETTPPNVATFLDRSVTEATTYRYRVRARLDQLASEWSAEASATTPSTPPAAPSGLVALTLSRTSIRLTWIDNASNETAMRVELEGPAGGWGLLTSLPANSTTYDVTDLQPRTTYNFRLFALNSAGDSDPSNVASATTLTDVPAAPSNLAGTALDFDKVRLTWADNSDNETGFDILRQVGAAPPVHLTAAADATTFDDTSVSGGTTYSYSVRAVRDELASSLAGPIQVQTPIGPPSVPANLVATAAGSTQINLTWEASTGPLTGYVIAHRPPGATGFADLVTVSAPTLAYSVKNLLPNSTYTYRVRSRNAVRDSEPGNEASATTDQVPPAAPTGLAGTALVGGTSVELDWTDNATNEVGFRVEARLNGTLIWGPVATPAANVTTATIGNLIPNTNYDFRVFATNEKGDSGPSNVIPVRTLQAPPPTPVNVSASATSSSRIDLAWQAGTGGGLPTDYSIERRQAPAVTFTPLASPSASQLDYGDTGLIPNTRYDYRLRAHNSAGYSAYSDTVSATTPLDPPGAPGGLDATAVAQSSSAIDLVWNPPSTGGAPDFYDVRFRTLGSNTFGPATPVTVPTTVLRVSGLQPLTTYEFVVEARNAAGTSPQSNIARATTNPLPPAAPTNLVGVLDNDYVVHLDWVDNATNETQYELQRALDAPTLAWAVRATLPPNSVSYSENGGFDDLIYHYRVLARNSGGDSDFSNELVVDTSLPAPGDFLPYPLSATQIILEWRDYVSGEIGYEIERGTPISGGYSWSPLGIANPGIEGSGNYTVGGLNSVSTYYFRIRTLGAGGRSSTWVGPLPAKTAGTQPPAPSGLVLSWNPTSRQMLLTWNDNSLNEARFDVSRATGTGTLAPLGTSGINERQYYDFAVPIFRLPTLVRYRVGATNAAGTLWSAEVSLTIQ